MKYIGILLLVLAVCGFDNLDLGVPGPADQIVDREGYALISALTSDPINARAMKGYYPFYA